MLGKSTSILKSVKNSNSKIGVSKTDKLLIADRSRFCNKLSALLIDGNLPLIMRFRYGLKTPSVYLFHSFFISKIIVNAMIITMKLKFFCIKLIMNTFNLYKCQGTFIRKIGPTNSDVDCRFEE